MKEHKSWLLVEEKDEHDHWCAYVVPVTSCNNLLSIVGKFHNAAFVAVYGVKKTAEDIAGAHNKDWHNRGICKFDYV